MKILSTFAVNTAKGKKKYSPRKKNTARGKKLAGKISVKTEFWTPETDFKSHSNPSPTSETDFKSHSNPFSTPETDLESHSNPSLNSRRGRLGI